MTFIFLNYFFFWRGRNCYKVFPGRVSPRGGKKKFRRKFFKLIKFVKPLSLDVARGAFAPLLLTLNKMPPFAPPSNLRLTLKLNFLKHF